MTNIDVNIEFLVAVMIIAGGLLILAIIVMLFTAAYRIEQHRRAETLEKDFTDECTYSGE